jgi:hypothetical protein
MADRKELVRTPRSICPTSKQLNMRDAETLGVRGEDGATNISDSHMAGIGLWAYLATNMVMIVQY